jgi:hypothetical protein
MVAICVSAQRLYRMVHAAGLLHGTDDRLETGLDIGCFIGLAYASSTSDLQEMIVGTTNKFTDVKKRADDIAILLEPARPRSSLPAILIGLHGNDVFHELVKLQLPADVTKNVHLEDALAAQRLAVQEFIDLHIHVYEQVFYIGIYNAVRDIMTGYNPLV